MFETTCLLFIFGVPDVDQADDEEGDDEDGDGRDGDIVSDGAAHEGQPYDQAAGYGDQPFAKWGHLHGVMGLLSLALFCFCRFVSLLRGAAMRGGIRRCGRHLFIVSPHGGANLMTVFCSGAISCLSICYFTI